MSESKVLCHPASVDSIPSSASREGSRQHGEHSARKLDQVIANVRKALAIEILTAAKGSTNVALCRPVPGYAPPTAWSGRRYPRFPRIGRCIGIIACVDQMIVDGSLLEAVEAAVGPLE